MERPDIISTMSAEELLAYTEKTAEEHSQARQEYEVAQQLYRQTNEARLKLEKQERLLRGFLCDLVGTTDPKKQKKIREKANARIAKLWQEQQSEAEKKIKAKEESRENITTAMSKLNNVMDAVTALAKKEEPQSQGA